MKAVITLEDDSANNPENKSIAPIAHSDAAPAAKKRFVGDQSEASAEKDPLLYITKLIDNIVTLSHK